MSNNSKKGSIIATNIRRLRTERDISQDKLSKLADISLHTLTKIESGDTPNPTIETMQKIANAFDVSVDYLINLQKV